MVAKPTISTSQAVREESKEERNFHWVYVMRKMQAAKDEWGKTVSEETDNNQDESQLKDERGL